MIKSAKLSDDGTYRYTLERTWNDEGETVCFIMLNPSTADALDDDPTIRRCVGLSRECGYGGLVVVNLFAFRSTDPKSLPASDLKAIGPMNDEAIIEATAGRYVFVAWGAHKKAKWRGMQVLKMLNRQVWCFGKTRDGSPKHPLYLPSDTAPQIFWYPTI